MSNQLTCPYCSEPITTLGTTNQKWFAKTCPHCGYVCEAKSTVSYSWEVRAMITDEERLDILRDFVQAIVDGNVGEFAKEHGWRDVTGESGDEEVHVFLVRYYKKIAKAVLDRIG